MESVNSSSSQPQNSVATEETIAEESSEQWFTEQFENLLPNIGAHKLPTSFTNGGAGCTPPCG